ncbi:MAG: hypothetical protein IJT88_09490 [Kiritimatiellae bacterium]|nr:hypothetical protein [Kiritimatiellia bacterium]
MQEATTGRGEVQQVRRVIWTGVGAAAAAAHVTTAHISYVLRGERPGSAKVWDAIEAVGVRNGLTGRLAKRPRRAGRGAKPVERLKG